MTVAVQPILLLAASGLAREVLSVLRTAVDRRVVGFLDDDVALHGTAIDGVPVLGGIDAVSEHPVANLVVCAGSGQARSAIVARLAECGVEETRYARVIDPDVRIPPSCTVGEGTIVLAGTVFTADVTIGRHVVAMPNVVLTHDDTVEDYATLCAGVALGGRVHVGRGAYLGMNASVRQGLRIGAEATLGMGAALLSDLPDGERWAGVPAKTLTNEGVTAR
jgi:sugar O-acyltransferase (sialic acid O-acetyltransferase NeuD family)